MELKAAAARPRRSGAMLLVGVAGFATAALVGIAAANTLTLQAAKDASVTNTIGVTKRESIVVNSRGRAVYDLTGDSKHHPKCTKANHCFTLWPPVTVASAKKLSKTPGIKGRLGVWHRDGFLQVTLGGHPLYRFAPDSRRHVATGEGINSFHGTWHVVTASVPGSGTGTQTSTGTTTGTGTTTTTTTTTCGPPPKPPCFT